MKKILIYFFFLITFISLVNSNNLISCRIGQGSLVSNVCNSDEEAVFYLNKNFFQIGSPLKVLSDKTSINFLPLYDKAICCKTTNPKLGNIKFNSTVLSNQVCPVNYKELLYFTKSNNGKIGYPKSIGFNKNHYTNKLCVKVPKAYSNLDIQVNGSDFSVYGYTCLFKTNELQNSVVSSCDASFGASSKKYNYTVWARLWEDSGSIKCNNDCTSKLDDRVYSSCSLKVISCKNIPSVCNGALLNSWVKFDNFKDVQCSKPWNNFRNKTFSDQTLKVKVIDDSKCPTLIKKKYSVILNNELVTMDIFTCNN